jgi:L-ascorbate 6-phosphate lactonase
MKSYNANNNEMESLMEKILASTPENSEIQLWWIGQSGFIIKTSYGKVLVIDAYLSNSAKKVRTGLDRQVPIPILPEELVYDYYICTHNHLDHADPDTIRNLRNKDAIRFIGPRNVVKAYLQLGVPEKNIRLLEAGEKLQLGDLILTGTYCIPNSEAVLDSIGIILQFDNKTIYHSGDTGYHRFLGYVSKYNIHMALLCINGKFGNMNIVEAYSLCQAINPKYAVPCHFDMFPINQENPELFKQLFITEKSKTKCIIPEIGNVIKI